MIIIKGSTINLGELFFFLNFCLMLIIAGLTACLIARMFSANYNNENQRSHNKKIQMYREHLLSTATKFFNKFTTTTVISTN